MPRLHGYHDEELRTNVRRELRRVYNGSSALRDRCIDMDTRLAGLDMEISTVAMQAALSARGLVLLANAIAEKPPRDIRVELPKLTWWRRAWWRLCQRRVAFAIVAPKKLKALTAK